MSRRYWLELGTDCPKKRLLAYFKRKGYNHFLEIRYVYRILEEYDKRVVGMPYLYMIDSKEDIDRVDIDLVPEKYESFHKICNNKVGEYKTAQDCIIESYDKMIKNVPKHILKSIERRGKDGLLIVDDKYIDELKALISKEERKRYYRYIQMMRKKNDDLIKMMITRNK